MLLKLLNILLRPDAVRSSLKYGEPHPIARTRATASITVGLGVQVLNRGVKLLKHSQCIEQIIGVIAFEGKPIPNAAQVLCKGRLFPRVALPFRLAAQREVSQAVSASE